MVKRKKARKLEAKEAVGKSVAGGAGKGMLMPVLLMQILAVFLGVILIVALTLFVLGRMPARGFFTLAAILALLAFVVMPAMRKRFLGVK